MSIDEISVPSLRDNLIYWAHEHNIPRNALSALLKILKIHSSNGISSDQELFFIQLGI